MKSMTTMITGRAPSGRQRGLVLFIALVALLVLSLAAVALIRSVDTATVIAGNMAFKQSTTNSADIASIEANAWLAQQATLNPANPPLNTNNTSQGYYALITYDNEDGTNPARDLKDPNNWTDATSRTAVVIGGGNTDPSGNQIRYIVERMCRTTGPVSGGTADPNQACLFGPSELDGCSKGIDQREGGDIRCQSNLVMYRITARVQGPKGTMSYTQTFVY